MKQTTPFQCFRTQYRKRGRCYRNITWYVVEYTVVINLSVTAGVVGI